MRKNFLLSLICLLLAGCMYALPTASVVKPIPTTAAVVNKKPSDTPVPVASATATSTPQGILQNEYSVPNFDHIVLIVLENEYLQNVIGSPRMSNLSSLAKQNVLLNNYSAITHPSLPNYLAMVSGSTQNITSDCTDCFVAGPNLADEIDASGRTWKAYFEDMPSPCFVGNKKPYVQFFNPFIYFDSIRLDVARCDRSIVPLTQLEKDMTAGQLPNFVYIAPNLCNSGHDCSPETADKWLGEMVAKLQASPALGQNSLIMITFDEGVQQPVPVQTHGEVATLLISPLAQKGFVDTTGYSHFSLLKTILFSWNLPALGQTQWASTNVIVDPWIDQMGSIYPHELTVNP